MKLLKRSKPRRSVWLKGLTLVELFIAISIFAIMVVALSNIDTFSRYHLATSDKRAKLQNDVTYVLEHMSRNFIGVGNITDSGAQQEGAIGDITNPTSSYPVALTTIGGDNAIVINIDYSGGLNSIPNGKWDGTTTDRQIAYRYSGSPNYQIWYYAPYSGGTPVSYTVLTASRIRGNFTSTTTDPTYVTYNSAYNYVEVQIGACWDPSSGSTCGTPDNPAISAKTRIYMPLASTH